MLLLHEKLFHVLSILGISPFGTNNVFLSPQSEFCGDKPKSGAKFGLPDSLSILSEMGEVTDGVMDNKVICRFARLMHNVFITEVLFAQSTPPFMCLFRWCIISPIMLKRSSPSTSRTNFLVQKLCKSK